MAPDILTEIVEYKQYETGRKKQYRTEASLRADAEALAQSSRRGFASAMTSGEPDRTRIIAEIKRASPSKGVIRPDLDAAAFASMYEQGGAAAISVLTEEKWFKGSVDDLTAARNACDLPVLRKDFMVSAYQIYESAVINADAILLIARILGKNQLKDYLDLCAMLGLDVLVEIHSEEDLAKTDGTGARLIGINNRNLKSFDVDMEVSSRLASRLTLDQIPVAASGIRALEDIMAYRDAGIYRFLIGESIVRADDPEQFIKELLS
jgi:indole-3-glycerol phosphate synthase